MKYPPFDTVSFPRFVIASGSYLNWKILKPLPSLHQVVMKSDKVELCHRLAAMQCQPKHATSSARFDFLRKEK
jgi:hypothetical protein